MGVVPYLIGEAHRRMVLEAFGEAEKLLDRLVERTKDAGIAYSVHVVTGAPATHIPIFASNNDCNIVIMCTDVGEDSVKLAIGGIAERVFQKLGVPLLIVH